MRKIFALLVCTIFLSGGRLSAQTVVFDSDRAESWQLADHRNIAEKSVLNVIEDADGKIFDIEVFKGDRSQYAVGFSFPVQQHIAKGHSILATMTMRTIYARQETGESAVSLMVQEPGPTYKKSVNVSLGSDSEWTTFYVPFKAHTDFEGNWGRVELALGALSQHVQVKDIVLTDYGDTPLEDLPKTKFTYAGREEGAEWREEALERIDEIRTSPVKVTVRDSKGRAVKGAEISVRMDRSDFLWGTAVNAPAMFRDHKLDTAYAAHLSENFNTAIIGNGLKVGGWYWDNDRKECTLLTFKWLCDNGFRQRGHNLVWPGWKFNPRAAKIIAQQDPEVFDRYIKAQFYERMAYAKGKVVAWDVVNEPMHEREFFKYLPEDVMVDWFKLAKSLDPDAQLFINDYSMLNCAQSKDNIAMYVDMIADLLAKGAPVEAIGVQGHIGTQPRAPQLVLSDLDMFIPLGLPVQITEFDINTKDEELQADYMRDFLIAVYSHQCVTGVNMWGFWEKDHWKPDAALFRTDWSPRPCAEMWKKYVLGEWRTNVTSKSDRKGCFETKAHFGEYTVRVEYKGKVVERKCHIGKDGAEFNFEM